MHKDTMPWLLEKRAYESPNLAAHWTLDDGGKWRPTTWQAYFAEVSRLAAGLQAIGLVAGDNIGIMARTTQTWEYLQMAVLMSGGVIVGIDPHDRNENVNEIASRAGLTGIIVENFRLLDKITEQVSSNFRFAVSIDEERPDDAAKKVWLLKDIVSEGGLHAAPAVIKAKLKKPATIIFTSGTTGVPKGIMYTHEQLVLACRSLLENFDDIREGSTQVCWLPLSNLFQRMVNFCAIIIGASTHFVGNPQEIIKYLPSINPHVFIGVPRFYEKLYGGMTEEIAKKPRWMRALVERSFKVGDDYATALRQGKNPGFSTRIAHAALDPLVLKRFRQILGRNIKYMISGSAPMPRWLLERFHAMGILILEAYGISENIIPVAANRPKAFKFGTVGKPLSGNEIKFSDDGELLVKGPGVFAGYYRDDSQKDYLTPDGYLKTGDYVSIDEEGLLSLTGRKSEIFKTSTGRRVAPTGIENLIAKVSYVEHAAVFGAGRKFLIALLSIDPRRLADRGRDRGLKMVEGEGAVCAELCEIIKTDVIRELSVLPAYQRPAGLLVSPNSFTIEGGELTGNLKLRRENVAVKYQEQIVNFFTELEELAGRKREGADGAADIRVKVI